MHHPVYLAFERRWQLPVYFQLRWKEIVSRLEESLSTKKMEPSSNTGRHSACIILPRLKIRTMHRDSAFCHGPIICRLECNYDKLERRNIYASTQSSLLETLLAIIESIPLLA